MACHAIKLYVAKVAAILNEQRFHIGKRKVIGTDVLRAKPMDELHELAVKLFKQNRKMVKEHV
ncbi:hypothetical protein [Lysinibacillus contaminans]|uniref:hypothetical protein n=1 Tax=Lysinibacillus contaminans TaxID=1293441 RepID=UPI0012E1BA71|nr:hypothetical protein [Lysinibacillus contaminans]